MADPNDSIAYLRSLVERMPENKDLPKPQFFMDPRSLSMANILKGGANTALNWLEGKPEIGPDTLAPLGLAPMGALVGHSASLAKPSIADSARARYLEWKHPDDLPTVTGGDALHPDSATQMANADKIRSWPNPAIKDAAYPTQKPYDADHTIANERGTPRDRFRLLAENDSTAGNIINSLPMDEASRLNRAREMGFDTDRVIYRGMHHDVDAFRPSEGGVYGPGVYGSTRQGVANAHAGAEDGAAVYPFLARGKMATMDDLERATNQANAEGFKRSAGYKRANEILAEEGFTGVRDQDLFNIFDPKNTRSPNAAFNPLDSDKAGLLLSDQSRASVPGTVVNAQEERTPTLAEILMRGSY